MCQWIAIWYKYFGLRRALMPEMRGRSRHRCHPEFLVFSFLLKKVSIYGSGTVGNGSMYVLKSLLPGWYCSSLVSGVDRGIRRDGTQPLGKFLAAICSCIFEATVSLTSGLIKLPPFTQSSTKQ
jgi:hypothetical protein